MITSSKTTTSSKTKKFKSIQKVTTPHAFEEFENLKKFKSIRRVTTTHTFEELEDEKNSSQSGKFISEKIGYSGERFRPGNVEWMYLKPTMPSKTKKIQVDPESYDHAFEFRVRRWKKIQVDPESSLHRRLGTLENVFDWEMKSECIQSQPSLQRVRRRKNSSRSGKFISEKAGYSGECFRLGNEEWMYSSFQKRLGTLENIFAFRGNKEWMYSKPTTPSKSSKTSTSFREDFILKKITYTRERFRSENEEWMYSNTQRDLTCYIKICILDKISVKTYSSI